MSRPELGIEAIAERAAATWSAGRIPIREVIERAIKCAVKQELEGLRESVPPNQPGFDFTLEFIDARILAISSPLEGNGEAGIVDKCGLGAEGQAGIPAVQATREGGIYVASKLRHADSWRKKRDEGVPISSRWIDSDLTDDSASDRAMEQAWLINYEDLFSCVCLVAFAEEADRLGGAMAEIGGALALGKRVFLCGSNPAWASIMYHPLVTYTDVRKALEAATELVNDKRGNSNEPS